MIAPSLTEQYRRMSSLVQMQKTSSGNDNISRSGTARVPSQPFTSEKDRIRNAKHYVPQILQQAQGMDPYRLQQQQQQQQHHGFAMHPQQQHHSRVLSYTPAVRPANIAPRGKFAISIEGRPQRTSGLGGPSSSSLSRGRIQARGPIVAPSSALPSTMPIPMSMPARTAFAGPGSSSAFGAGFRYHVEPSKHLNPIYHQTLQACGGADSPTAESANIVFLSQQSCRAIMEAPITAHLDMLPDAKVAYISGESILIDHVLREELRREYLQSSADVVDGGATVTTGPILPMSEFAVSYRRSTSSIVESSRWLVRPRVGPLGPTCHIQEMNSPVWYNPEAMAIRLPSDMYQEQDFFTVLRTAVLVCATGHVYLSADGELLFYDTNDFSRPPRQESLRSIGISTADVFGEGVREIFRAFFLSPHGQQQMFQGQFQIFWIDALTRKEGGRLRPWWIDVHAVMLSPARRSMFVNASEADKIRALRSSGKAAVRLAKSIVRGTSDHLSMAVTAAMIKTCIDCLLRPNSSMLILDVGAEVATRTEEEGECSSSSSERMDEEEEEEDEESGAGAGASTKDKKKRSKKQHKSHASAAAGGGGGKKGGASKEKSSRSSSKRRRHVKSGKD